MAPGRAPSAASAIRIRYPEECYGDAHIAGVLTGSGDHEGLTAYLMWDAQNHDHTFDGLIFPGDMPE